MDSTPLTPAEVFPVGEYLRDELEARGWNETEFAQILGRPAQAVSEIINGKKEITAETAVAIADALGTSAELWLGLQTDYRLRQVRAGRPVVNPITRLAALRASVPLRELRRRGWISSTNDPDTLEREVSMLLAPLTDHAFRAAARRSNTAHPFTPEQNAWIARIMRRAADVAAIADFDQLALAALAERLPRMLTGPDQLPVAAKELARCGVVLVVEPQLAGSKLDGVALVMGDGRHVVALTTRGDRFDGFLFTLLHELAHIVLGHLDATGWQIDDAIDDSPTEIGRSADAQAAGWIFPHGFVAPRPPVTMTTIHELAREHGVHPSVVVGRLHRDEVLEWSQFRRSIPKVRAALGIS